LGEFCEDKSGVNDTCSLAITVYNPLDHEPLKRFLTDERAAQA
jgi:hypothetical protein